MRTFATFAAIALSLAVAGTSAQSGRPFHVTLTGAEEVPGPGDPDGAGEAVITLNPGLQQVCYQIIVSNITLPATGAHIHVAPAGDSGPVVVALAPPGADGTSSGCVTADRDLIMQILINPTGYYVNVHTLPLYAAGAVRGQLGYAP
jgi:hypothetical protein